MTALRALLAALASAAPVAARAADPARPPLCEAKVEIAPERARPGEQVRHRLRLLVRSDVDEASWEEPPSFPGLRAERLATRPAAGRVARGGADYEIREDERALFADRPGRAVIPPARLLCRAAGGASLRVATPEAELLVLPFPEAGRPPGFRGLSGPLSAQLRLTPESVSLGRSVRLTATLEGAGNLWDAAPPELGALAEGGVEILPGRAQTELDRGAELIVRRRFAIDLVPRREGVLRIPALAWPYFDPVSERYAQAVAGPIEVAVGPPAAGAPAAAAAGGADERGGTPARASEGSAPAESGRRAAAIAASGLLLAALAAVVWRARRRRQARAERVANALARADAARDGGDRDGELAALARALRAALGSAHGPAAQGPPAAAARPGRAPAAREALSLLEALERARFDPQAPAPDRDSVRRALAALGT